MLPAFLMLWLYRGDFPCSFFDDKTILKHKMSSTFLHKGNYYADTDINHSLCQAIGLFGFVKKNQ